MIDRSLSCSLCVLLLALLIGGCAVTEGPKSEPRGEDDEPRPAARLLQQPDDPMPVSLPEDAAPHNRLTEWWYYTGHLEGADGNLYGFEFVIFQARRADYPPAYASHFAITDVSAGEFQYAERVQNGEQPPGEEPVDLSVEEWSLSGGDGTDRIQASMDGYELSLTLEAEKDPVLHDGDGYFQFAPAAESYYYSRTRMSASGTLTVDGEPVEVSGESWFDQQWGDFLMTADAGWDWFSMQMDNGEELMAWQSHDRSGNVLDGSATVVDEDGDAVDIPHDGLRIEPTGQWQSPRTGATYPMGWTVEVPEHEIELSLTPVMEDQELITVESTGQVYWEGMIRVGGTWEGREASGLGYVELTGYAPAMTPSDT